MGLIHIMERGGAEERRFKEALVTAKEAIEEICELTERMEEEFGQRGSARYGSRDGMSGRGSYRWEDDMSERRSRDRMGRYR